MDFLVTGTGALEPVLQPEEPEFVRCCKCGQELYPGEEAVTWSNGMICQECLDEEWNDLDIYTKARYMQEAVVTVEKAAL